MILNIVKCFDQSIRTACCVLEPQLTHHVVDVECLTRRNIVTEPMKCITFSLLMLNITLLMLR